MKISIIVSAYQRPAQSVLLCHSFICQTYTDWEIIFFHDGPNEEIKKTITGIGDSRIRYFESIVRYNNFGHSLRSVALEHVTGDFVLWTNDDNYYAPVFLKRMTDRAILTNADLIYCDMVHSHQNYSYFKCELRNCGIDMGAFMVKVEIAKKIGFPDRGFCADGLFIEKAMALPNIKTAKAEGVLFVHN